MAGLYHGDLPKDGAPPIFLVTSLLNICAIAQLVLKYPQDERILALLEKVLSDLNIEGFAEHVYHLTKNDKYDLEKNTRWPDIRLKYIHGGVTHEHIHIALEKRHEDVSEDGEVPGP